LGEISTRLIASKIIGKTVPGIIRMGIGSKMFSRIKGHGNFSPGNNIRRPGNSASFK